ncbi:hypothetical protein E2562_034324 [Oryza meyeriana var. granulata]|uniref:Uncharacterized protein n=1 Tax=Oryza meyeriana var. granulata TaxID=110450 RepID=A0A6G1FFG2_9ORYZ|nr:hypothetical protein E2562_034324 [Oryza meyeriana var. granulata]
MPAPARMRRDRRSYGTQPAEERRGRGDDLRGQATTARSRSGAAVFLQSTSDGDDEFDSMTSGARCEGEQKPTAATRSRTPCGGAGAEGGDDVGGGGDASSSRRSTGWKRCFSRYFSDRGAGGRAPGSVGGGGSERRGRTGALTGVGR